MTRTIMRWLSPLLLFLLLCGAGSVSAEEGQIYTIKKGDTLWDLSKRFIDDPYYWPNIWSKNPEITNPHLIFPGQKIRILDGRLEIIPAYQEAGKPSESTPTISATESLGQVQEKDDLLIVKAAGGGNDFIRTTEQSLGLIVDSVDNRVLLTANDTVFVKMNDTSSVSVGDIYGIYSSAQEIKHPQTKEPIGTLMHDLGYIRVTEIAGDTVVAKIEKVYREVTRGAELFEYSAPNKEIVLQRGSSNKQGFIIAARNEKSTYSTHDVVFINLGQKDAVKRGNLLYVTRPRIASDEIVKKVGQITLPDEVLGAAVVVETKEETASILFIKSVDAAFVGDQVSIVTK